jgi:hypothetical protein
MNPIHIHPIRFCRGKTMTHISHSILAAVIAACLATAGSAVAHSPESPPQADEASYSDSSSEADDQENPPLEDTTSKEATSEDTTEENKVDEDSATEDSHAGNTTADDVADTHAATPNGKTTAKGSKRLKQELKRLLLGALLPAVAERMREVAEDNRAPASTEGQGADENAQNDAESYSDDPEP